VTRADAPVSVSGSATFELEWALYRIKRAIDLGEDPDLGPGVSIPSSLAREVAGYWSDGSRMFTELPVLAHRTGAAFELDITPFFRRLPTILASALPLEIGLMSEPPEERATIQRRILRLAREPELMTSYLTLLDSVWAAIVPVWKAAGLAAVRSACEAWRVRLLSGRQLTELLPAEHTAFSLGLVPLLEARTAKGEVVLTPSYFIRWTSVLDLPGVLSVGVTARDEAIDDRGDRLLEKGLFAAQKVRILANPQRAAVLAAIVAAPSTASEVARELRILPAAVRRYVRTLVAEGLVEAVSDGGVSRYRVVERSLDSLLNEVSWRIGRNQSRATELNAAHVSADASFQAIFDRAPIAIIQLDLQGRCLSCNEATQRVFGYTLAEIGQLRAKDLLADDGDHSTFEAGPETGPGQPGHEVRLRRKDGSIFWSSVTVSTVHDKDGQPRFAYAMLEDVSERRGAEDLVTGLPNRALFMSRLERLLARTAGEPTSITLLMIDLDRFKQVNDTFGHEAGDELLKLVGVRLAATLRATDMVARLGGDEFAIIIAGVLTAVAVARVAEKIAAALAEPFVLSGGRIASIGGSVGVATSPQDGVSAALLMKHADTAMYETKRGRRDQRTGTRLDRQSALPDSLRRSLV